MAAPVYEVSQNDLRELRRVFEWLADFAPKYKVRAGHAPRRAAADADDRPHPPLASPARARPPRSSGS